MGNLFNLDSPVMRFLSRITDIILLNILFVICSIPIVTIGASCTALYSITLKMVKNEESYIVKGFLKAFKENFKISTILWLIMLVLGGLLIVDYRIAPALPSTISNIFKGILIMFAGFYTITLLYLFPYVARFENSVKGSFKNAILISILNLPFTLLIAVLTIGLGVLTILNTLTLVYGMMIWVICGFAALAFVNSLMFRKIFAKYEPHEEELDKLE